MAKKSLAASSKVQDVDIQSAIDSYDALTYKLGQANRLATLMRTSGEHSCVTSITTCAGLLEDLLESIHESASHLYQHARSSQAVLSSAKEIVDGSARS